MSIVIKEDTTNLAVGADGAIRIGGTRVTLDTVASFFSRGATAEEIADSFPALALADIYSAIAYYLRHREELDAYLAQRQVARDRVRQENQRRFGRTDLRARLLARQRESEQ